MRVSRLHANLLLLCSTVVMFLLCAEGILRFLSNGDVPRRFDARVGMMNAPHDAWTMRTPEYRTHVRTNALGFRGPELPGERVPEEYRILFLGDSFVEAKQVEEADRMAERVGEALRKQWNRPVTVRAFAVGGANPAEELLFWRTWGKDYRPDLVVQVLFPENDLLAASGSYRFGHDPDGTLTVRELWASPPAPCGWKCILLEQSVLLRRIYHLVRTVTDRNTSPKHVLLDFYVYIKDGQEEIRDNALLPIFLAFSRSLRKETCESDAPLLTVLMPGFMDVQEEWAKEVERRFSSLSPQSVWQPSGLLNDVAEAFRQAGLPALDLRPAFRSALAANPAPLYFRLDPHLSVRGNAVAAETIADTIVDGSLLARCH